MVASSSSFFMPPQAHAAYVKLPESLQEMSDRIATEHDISTSSLANLVKSESDWDPDIPGDFNKKKGIYCSWGLTQQNLCAHPEITKEQAIDPEWALNKAAQDIEDGMDYIYTSCNCYSLVSVRVKGLPRMAAITPNSNAREGGVAIFYYKDKATGEWVKHIAYILKMNGSKITILEANYHHCLVDTRVIPISDPNLAGFWYAAEV